SGTSMATPHVTGAAALYLAGATASTTPAAVRSALVGNATKNVVSGLKPRDTSPNALLYTG
ncbi:MAG TPA: S8 family serine peptidase, partial [Sporichthya sp.]|nr:S8 family serine peptidase [Sporichthya sp.]